MESRIIDIILLIPLLWGLIGGLFKGFAMSVGSIIGLVLAIYVASWQAPTVSEYLTQEFVLSGYKGYIISFIIIFAAVALSFLLVVKILDKLLDIISLKWLNKLLGGVFGLLKYALILSVVINLFEIVNVRVNFISEEKKQSSVLYQPIQKVVPAIMPYVEFYIDNNEQAS